MYTVPEIFFNILLLMYDSERIVLGLNFQNGDFDEFITRFVSPESKNHIFSS